MTSLEDVKKGLHAGHAANAYERQLAAEEELAYAGAETLFSHPAKPKFDAQPIRMQQAPYEADAPLTSAVVPCGQGTIERDTLGGIKKGDPVTVAEMMLRNDFLAGQFKEYTSTYYYSAAAIVCGLVAIAFCLVPQWGPWAAAVFAILSGYSYAMYLWNHYWVIDYMRVRTMMIPT